VAAVDIPSYITGDRRITHLERVEDYVVGSRPPPFFRYFLYPASAAEVRLIKEQRRVHSLYTDARDFVTIVEGEPWNIGSRHHRSVNCSGIRP
jgi:hypothetical protein